MQVFAPAKINLTLDILDRRPDGYHNISSVMQTLRWGDWLEIGLSARPGEISLKVFDSHGVGPIPEDETNLAHRAVSAILSATKSKSGVRIALGKHIPSQAGLGGGSSDAASTLLALNSLLGNPLSKTDLVAIGAGLGGDVPFFLTGGTCLVEGIGERVTPLAEFASHNVVIVKPEAGVSTATAYRRLDECRGGKAPAARTEWDGRTLRNDFEPIVQEICPAIAAARAALVEAGCTDVLLCGSGSAVFGFPGPEDSPDATGRRLSTRSLGTVISTSTINRTELEVLWPAT